MSIILWTSTCSKNAGDQNIRASDMPMSRQIVNHDCFSCQQLSGKFFCTLCCDNQSVWVHFVIDFHWKYWTYAKKSTICKWTHCKTVKKQVPMKRRLKRRTGSGRVDWNAFVRQMLVFRTRFPTVRLDIVEYTFNDEWNINDRWRYMFFLCIKIWLVRANVRRIQKQSEKERRGKSKAAYWMVCKVNSFREWYYLHLGCDCRSVTLRSFLFRG